jgi:hypothetical protein
VAKNVEEIRDSMGQDKVSIGASINSSSSLSPGSPLCLMVRDLKVSPPLKPSSSCDEEDEDIYEEEEVILRREGEIIYNDLPKIKVRSLFINILTIAIESQTIIKQKGRIRREDCFEKFSLNNSLE